MNKKQIVFIGIMIALTGAIQSNAKAQTFLLNEVEVDPPSTISDACQYTEVRGINPGVVLLTRSSYRSTAT